MTSDSPNPDRLARAVDAFLAHRDAGLVDDESFLSRHEDLRDLLEPMMVEVEPDAGRSPNRPVGNAADSTVVPRPDRQASAGDDRDAGSPSPGGGAQGWD
jgi:hypothetical protein